MKIKIPETIEIVGDEATGELVVPAYTFDRFVKNILGDPKWGESMATIYMAMDLRGLFTKPGEKPRELVPIEPGEVVELTAEQGRKMQEVLSEPTGGFVSRNDGFSFGILMHVRPYLDAVLKPFEPGLPAKEK